MVSSLRCVPDRFRVVPGLHHYRPRATGAAIESLERAELRSKAKTVLSRVSVAQELTGQIGADVCVADGVPVLDVAKTCMQG